MRIEQIVNEYLNEYLVYLAPGYTNPWKAMILWPQGEIRMPYPQNEVELWIFFHEIGHQISHERGWKGSFNDRIGQRYANRWADKQMKKHYLPIPTATLKPFLER